jgi:hypothetical protein
MFSFRFDLCARCSGKGSEKIHYGMPDVIIPFRGNILLPFVRAKERNGLGV